MAVTIDKGIVSDFEELKARLRKLGFTISGGKMRWGEAPQDSNCYWTVNSATDKLTINFQNSQGNKVFHEPLVHMAVDTSETPYPGYTPEFDPNYNDRTKAGFIFIKLMGGGCLLYLTPIHKDDDTLQYLYPSCYVDKTQTHKNGVKVKNNGIVICTPAEEDGKWRYSWRNDEGYDGIYPFDSSQGYRRETRGFFKWCIDNTQDTMSVGEEFPIANLIPAEMTLAMAKTYFSNGYWSNNIYNAISGNPPSDGVGTIFKINNQRYIIITDNNIWRCPVFKLPIEETKQNLSTSTEEYSQYKFYAVGDYCIYNGLLYKCIREVNQTGSFDDAYWKITTVYNEMHGL